MYLKLKVLALGPLFKELNVITLICLLLFVNLGCAGKLPLLKRDTSSSSSSSTSGNNSGLVHQNIEINLGLNNKKHQTEKVPAQSNVVINCNIEHLQGWYKNNDNMNVKLKSLTLKSIKKIDSGLYSCKSTTGELLNVTVMVTYVRNHNKTASSGESTFKKLRFINTSNMHSLMKKIVGDSVKFHCVLEEPAKNTKLTWTKNGKQLTRSGPVYFTKTSLQIDNLLTDDSGQYTCHTCNVKSCINFTTTLDVHETEDTRMDRFIANLVADPDLLVNDKNNEDDEDLYLEPGLRELKNQTSLFEPNNYLNDQPQNPANHNTSNDDETTRESKPYFFKPVSLSEVIYKPTGNVFRFTCNVKGNPEPTITWTKDNKTINRPINVPRYRNFSLIIEDLLLNDSGSYKCKACNEHGCIEHTARLHVVERIYAKPIIKELPKNLTVLLNHTAEFKCLSFSEFTVHIEWAKTRPENVNVNSPPFNVQKIQPDLNNPVILRIDNVAYEDEGWYTCYISNMMGTSTASAYLSVIAGLPVDKYDNEDVNDDDEDLYLEPEFRERRNKTTVSQPHDAETRGIIPYFSKPDSMFPSKIAKPSGNMVRLTCNVKGTPEPTLTWTKDAINISRQIGVAKYRKYALILEDLVPSDSGSYKCKACNEHGCIEHSTNLYVTARVKHPPLITQAPENLTMVVGESDVMHCKYFSDSHSQSEWIKGKCDNCTGKKILQTDSENSEILRLNNVTIEDEGWYTCYAANILGTSAASAYLSVVTELPVDKNDNDDQDLYLEPQFREHINETNVSQPNNDANETRAIIPYFSKPDSMDKLIAKPSGNMVRFVCNFKGTPEPTLTWTKDDITISRQMGVAKYRKYALILEDLVPSDSGSYKCKACNEHGCIEHSTNLYVTARVNHPPLITQAPENLTMVVGESDVMHCKYFSDSHSQSEWIKGKCDNCTGKKILQTDSENPEILHLYNVTFEDEGWYTCYVANSLGTSAASAYLSVVTELPVDPIKLPMHSADIDKFIANLVADPDSLKTDKNDNDEVNNDDDEDDLYWEPEFREQQKKRNDLQPNNYLNQNQQLINHNTTNLEHFNGNEEDEDLHTNLNNNSDIDDETNGVIPYFSKPDSMDKLVAKPSGNMVRLACNVKGNPEPTITWTKDDLTINRQMGAAKYRKYALILEDLVPSDSGSYKCKACNEHGCIEHSTNLYVTARVNHPPLITQAPDNLTMVVGESGVMHCKYFSDSHSQSEWIKGKCDNCTGKKILQTDSENPEILRLDNVTFEDEGWYTCYAANSLGTSAASAYLAVVTEFPVDPIKLPMRGLPVWLLILIIILASAFIIAIGVMCVIFKKLQIEKQNKNLNLEKVNMVTKKIIIVKPNSYNTNGNGMTDSISFPIVKIEKHRSVMLQNSNCEQSFESEYEFPIDEDWEILRSKLTLGRPLGEGEFGRVMMAEARDLFKPGSKTIVAVKMLKDGHTDQDVSDLVSEMELMKMIGKHINIINLLGCCTQDGPLHVIVEYAPHGNLRDFLKSNRLSNDHSDPSIQKKCFTEKELVSYAYQAARGMEYLASRRCVHRDLAARNVLVGEDYIIKIADFGLARDIHAQDYYRKNSDGRLPIKWMAPESLMYKKYDSKSDVWSYGILLWEIMSLGATPYPYMAKYTKMITTLQSGYRMEKPEYCSMDIYTLMRECWNFRPDQRPNFSEIVKDLDQILSRTSDKEYLDLGLPELETPPSSENESDTDTEEV